MTDIDRRMAQLLSEASAHHYSRRQLIKRGLALGVSMSAISGLLRSATAAPGSSQSATIAAQAATTLKLYHDKTPWQDFFTQMGQRAAKEIGIGFEPVSYADTTSYQQVILSSLPTKEAPDLFTWWSGYRIEDLHKQDALLDVSDIWATAIKDGNLPQSLGEAFTFDGKQYAMPSHVSYWVTFYNKKLFAQHDLTPPATWADLMAAADKLKAAGVTPFYATVDGRWPSFIWFEELLIRTDPQLYVDLTQGKKSYTDPAVVSVMETWKSMFDKGYFVKALDMKMSPDGATAFAKGEIAMFPIGTWNNAQFMTTGLKPGEDYDAFILPNVNPDLKENVIIVETGAIAIPAKAPHVAESQKVAAWWVTPEVQTEWCNKLGDAPANPKAKSENPVLAGVISTIDQKQYRLLQRYWEASPPQIVEAAVDELARFMLNPGDYKSVLETIQGIAETEWSKRT